MKIVVDTNLIIAGRWSPGSASNHILDLCIEGRFEAVYSRRIKEENLFILDKVRPDRGFIDKIIRFYSRARLVKPEKRVRICEDPDDDKYFECALAGGAKVIVSNDHHLLDKSGYEGVKVMRSGEFMRRFG